MCTRTKLNNMLQEYQKYPAPKEVKLTMSGFQ